MANEEKYAVVTGCASGIGYEIANSLNNKGIHVIGLDIETINDKFLSYVCDVSDENQVAVIMQKIKGKTSRIDYLVNAAGMLTIGNPLLIKELSLKQWDAIMRINLRSVLIMIKNIYPFMKEANGGSIVNISSEQSFNPDVSFSPYAVSKAGINMLTLSAAKEFLNDNIRVNAIALGTVKTNILKNMTITPEQELEMYHNKEKEIPFGVIEKQSVFELVDFLLSDKSRYITGEIVRCDGGLFLGSKK